MFFAGHMVIGYFASRVAGNKIGYSLPLIFAAALVPDLDFIFMIPHHELTHSILFTLLFYTPVFRVFGKNALPYFMATLSHCLIADVITGNPPLLLGVTGQGLGLGPYFAQSLGDFAPIVLASIEASAVAAYIAVSLVKRNLHPLFSEQHNIKHVLILGCVMFAIFVGSTATSLSSDMSTGTNVSKIIAYSIVGTGHLALFTLLLKGSIRKPVAKIPITAVQRI